jgi:hypothetical protein
MSIALKFHTHIRIFFPYKMCVRGEKQRSIVKVDSETDLAMFPVPDNNIVASIRSDKPWVSGMQQKFHYFVLCGPKSP